MEKGQDGLWHNNGSTSDCVGGVAWTDTKQMFKEIVMFS